MGKTSPLTYLSVRHAPAYLVLSLVADPVQSRNPRAASSDEPTLDAASDGSGSVECVGPECRVHLVRGSDSGRSGSMESLLRGRLRSASLLMFAGFAAFFVWHTVLIEFRSPLAVSIYAAHFVTTLILAAIGYSLSTTCPITQRQLRWIELVAFGAPLAFFVFMQIEKSIRWADEYGALPDISACWLLMIYTYALFIPNSWQRAAVAIGMMAAMAFVAIIGAALIDSRSAALLAADNRVLVETTLLMGIAAASAIVGVWTIHALRDEAQRAKQLGQYKLKRLIGSGGMGEVYLAEHLLMKRPCALKVIRPEKAGDPKVLARFEREVQATARLSHWNSVDIFDYGRTEDGTFYYVMEYLPGMNLSELVRTYGPLPVPRALHLVRQACNALSEAHELGLVHRDIKPANIFAAERGGRFDVAKVLDFGLAKPLFDTGAAQLTQEGTITGSPLFMSPEQAVGDREPDARSDIYALGGVLYFLLTGHPPFDDEKPMKVLIMHANERPIPPSRLNPEIPDDVEAIILRCLEKNPDDRFQSTADIVTAIEDCREYGRWTRDDARLWWKNLDAAPVVVDELPVA